MLYSSHAHPRGQSCIPLSRLALLLVLLPAAIRALAADSFSSSASTWCLQHRDLLDNPQAVQAGRSCGLFGQPATPASCTSCQCALAAALQPMAQSLLSHLSTTPPQPAVNPPPQRNRPALLSNSPSTFSNSADTISVDGTASSIQYLNNTGPLALLAPCGPMLLGTWAASDLPGKLTQIPSFLAACNKVQPSMPVPSDACSRGGTFATPAGESAVPYTSAATAGIQGQGFGSWTAPFPNIAGVGAATELVFTASEAKQLAGDGAAGAVAEADGDWYDASSAGHPLMWGALCSCPDSSTSAGPLARVASSAAAQGQAAEARSSTAPTAVAETSGGGGREQSGVARLTRALSKLLTGAGGSAGGSEGSGGSGGAPAAPAAPAGSGSHFPSPSPPPSPSPSPAPPAQAGMTAASVKSSEQQGPLCSLTSLLMYPDDCTARCMGVDVSTLAPCTSLLRLKYTTSPGSGDGLALVTWPPLYNSPQPEPAAAAVAAVTPSAVGLSSGGEASTPVPLGGKDRAPGTAAREGPNHQQTERPSKPANTARPVYLLGQLAGVPLSEAWGVDCGQQATQHPSAGTAAGTSGGKAGYSGAGEGVVVVDVVPGWADVPLPSNLQYTGAFSAVYAGLQGGTGAQGQQTGWMTVMDQQAMQQQQQVSSSAPSAQAASATSGGVDWTRADTGAACPVDVAGVLRILGDIIGPSPQLELQSCSQAVCLLTRVAAGLAQKAATATQPPQSPLPQHIPSSPPPLPSPSHVSLPSPSPLPFYPPFPPPPVLPNPPSSPPPPLPTTSPTFRAPQFTPTNTAPQFPTRSTLTSPASLTPSGLLTSTQPLTQSHPLTPSQLLTPSELLQACLAPLAAGLLATGGSHSLVSLITLASSCNTGDAMMGAVPGDCLPPPSATAAPAGDAAKGGAGMGRGVVLLPAFSTTPTTGTSPSITPTAGLPTSKTTTTTTTSTTTSTALSSTGAAPLSLLPLLARNLAPGNTTLPPTVTNSTAGLLSLLPMLTDPTLASDAQLHIRTNASTNNTAGAAEAQSLPPMLNNWVQRLRNASTPLLALADTLSALMPDGSRLSQAARDRAFGPVGTSASPTGPASSTSVSGSTSGGTSGRSSTTSTSSTTGSASTSTAASDAIWSLSTSELRADAAAAQLVLGLVSPGAAAEGAHQSSGGAQPASATKTYQSHTPSVLQMSQLAQSSITSTTSTSSSNIDSRGSSSTVRPAGIPPSSTFSTWKDSLNADAGSTTASTAGTTYGEGTSTTDEQYIPGPQVSWDAFCACPPDWAPVCDPVTLVQFPSACFAACQGVAAGVPCASLVLGSAQYRGETQSLAPASVTHQEARGVQSTEAVMQADAAVQAATTQGRLQTPQREVLLQADVAAVSQAAASQREVLGGPAPTASEIVVDRSSSSNAGGTSGGISSSTDQYMTYYYTESGASEVPC